MQTTCPHGSGMGHAIRQAIILLWLYATTVTGNFRACCSSCNAWRLSNTHSLSTYFTFSGDTNLVNFCGRHDESYTLVNASVGSHYTFRVNEALLPILTTCTIMIRMPERRDPGLRHAMSNKSVNTIQSQQSTSTSNGNNSRCQDFIQVGLHERRIYSDQDHLVLTLYKSTTWTQQQHVDLKILGKRVTLISTLIICQLILW